MTSTTRSIWGTRQYFSKEDTTTYKRDTIRLTQVVDQDSKQTWDICCKNSWWMNSIEKAESHKHTKHVIKIHFTIFWYFLNWKISFLEALMTNLSKKTFNRIQTKTKQIFKNLTTFLFTFSIIYNINVPRS